MNNFVDAENKGYLFFKVFFISLQFDNFIASYISVLPLILLSIFSLFNKIPRAMITGCNIFFIVLYALVFTIAIADIPYFSYFFTHLDASALNWFEFGQTTAGLIFREKSYYPYFGLILIAIISFSFIVTRFGKKLFHAQTINQQRRNNKLYSVCTETSNALLCS
ncbi:MAG: hypothetical protein LBS55_08035 [Prevotellaceae bacterium]|jgi:hypothetical protein|nr:hypothetical protein [Prevotellaceae bacterium]